MKDQRLAWHVLAHNSLWFVNLQYQQLAPKSKDFDLVFLFLILSLIVAEIS